MKIKIVLGVFLATFLVVMLPSVSSINSTMLDEEKTNSFYKILIDINRKKDKNFESASIILLGIIIGIILAIAQIVVPIVTFLITVIIGIILYPFFYIAFWILDILG